MEPDSINSSATKLMELSGTLVTREMQLKLLHDTMDDEQLIKSRILSSVTLKIGKNFHYLDLQQKLRNILLEARCRILRECAIVEADRDITKLCSQTLKLWNTFGEDCQDLRLRVSQHTEKIKDKIRKKHQKKKEFHLNRKPRVTHSPNSHPRKRNRHRKETKSTKKARRKRYLNNKKKRKQEWFSTGDI